MVKPTPELAEFLMSVLTPVTAKGMQYLVSKAGLDQRQAGYVMGKALQALGSNMCVVAEAVDPDIESKVQEVVDSIEAQKEEAAKILKEAQSAQGPRSRIVLGNPRGN